jgi:hypothetical protein
VNRDELLRMLDLTGKDDAPEDVVRITVAKPKRNAPSGVLPSPTALGLDEWALRRGKDLLEESDGEKRSGESSHAVSGRLPGARR